jgi:hypothetical protein
VAITVTFDSPRSRNIKFSGSEKVRRGTANLGIYVGPGGVTVTPANFQLRTLDHLDVFGALDGSTTSFLWDKANSKIKAFSVAGTEVVNGVDTTTKLFRFQALGT